MSWSLLRMTCACTLLPSLICRRNRVRANEGVAPWPCSCLSGGGQRCECGRLSSTLEPVYAQIIEGRLAPERLDDLERLVRDLLPTLRAALGFCGAVSLVERELGAALLVLLWETEEEAADSRVVDLKGLLSSHSTTIWEVDDRA